MLTRRGLLKSGVAVSAIGASIPSKAQTQALSDKEALLNVGTPAFWESKVAAGEQAGGLSISTADSPLRNAMDVYYDQLLTLVSGKTDNQKLLLNNVTA
jgi:hypothetical protein